MATKPRILTLDIETVPLESYTWGIWEQNVGLDMIKTEWSILSYAAKWSDQKKVIYRDTMGRGVAKVRDDKALLKDVWNLLNEADLVVGQNAQRFDVKKINARLIMNGFGPYSPIRVIDTMLASKKHFAFTSNKLEWLSEKLTKNKKLKHKRFPGFELWKECLKENPKARYDLEKYNKRDVTATEELWHVLRPWMDQHPNVGTYSIAGGPVCPKCGSPNVQKAGTRVLQQGSYQRIHCRDCGGWSREKQLLAPLTVRKGKLV